METSQQEKLIAIIGLGYVGMPLAMLFSKKMPVIGFDVATSRIHALQAGQDTTRHATTQELLALQVSDVPTIISKQSGLLLTHDPQLLSAAQIFIITVPTPTDLNNHLDLTNIQEACELVGGVLPKGGLVIVESTVYPGVTETIIIPLLEKTSGLRCNVDFEVGYSPERVNPGDTVHTLDTIIKLVAGTTPDTAQKVADLYKKIITAGVHIVPTIKAAEMSKLVENAQRDINIAFVNEVALLCHVANIATDTVLEAAATKWNFLPFKPGLVGGHCVGVASNYLQQLGQLHQQATPIMAAARAVNEGMSQVIAQEILQWMVGAGKIIPQTKVLILGLTFKEACADVRNSKIFEILSKLQQQGVACTVVDPWVDAAHVNNNYQVEVHASIPNDTYDVILVAVAHPEFKHWNLANYKHQIGIIYDMKGIIDLHVDKRL